MTIDIWYADPVYAHNKILDSKIKICIFSSSTITDITIFDSSLVVTYFYKLINVKKPTDFKDLEGKRINEPTTALTKMLLCKSYKHGPPPNLNA